MRIAVCIKQVPTREWQPRIDDSKRGVREQDASFEMNEPDAYALEESLRLREKHGGEVVACTAGPARASQVLREALARGADRAIHVEDDRLTSVGADPFVVAGALAEAVRGDGFDLVLTGLQSDDQGAAQTGVILAERLGVPHATIVMDVQAAGVERAGQARARGRLVSVGGHAASGGHHYPERHQPAAVCHAQGHHGREEERNPQGDVRRFHPHARRSSASTCHARPSRPGSSRVAPAEAAKELVRALKDEARVIG